MGDIASEKSSRMKRRKQLCKKIARILVLIACLSGFIFQTMEFLLLYWTYPTVVDIQKSSPSYLDIPAITVCNPIGYNFTALCTEFGISVCLVGRLLKFSTAYVCQEHQDICVNNKIPKDFTGITYNKFLKEIHHLEYKMHAKLRMKIEDYMNCTIEYLGEKKSCNMDYVMGSFYTKDELPSYCYTLYSLWGSPNKKREQIQKGAKMILEFNVNASGRDEPITLENVTGYIPKRNIPTSPSVQIAVHTPYFLPSPYTLGNNYQGGKAYELRLLMEETHLLPSPYQTNCTDYLKIWRENGGKGPVSQTGVVQECRAKRYKEQLGCVPIKVDYPHTDSICGALVGTNVTNPTQECMTLADSYNQPCDSISYSTEREEVEITVVIPIASKFLSSKEEVRKKIKGHDCSGRNIWNPECSKINIDILFDRFEITNLTYNPKFESLELFSAVGGYMGMWLGISLVAVYDFIFTVAGFIRAWMIRNRRRKIQPGKKGRSFYSGERKKHVFQQDDFQRKIYNW
ncbi:uncharacterized protein LOC129963015 [Argiope bruennichi]|uniref:uncharacterized protein LOC129963015 n=1 Tax=Argiope bruennichi TaxID=94029 RepID=UPI00249450B3|nr:uncharacterized protein LOC129963015 [Argiope bruennichi]